LERKKFFDEEKVNYSTTTWMGRKQKTTTKGMGKYIKALKNTFTE
jgi:hypothetical protein